ncbi:MAG: T9SS type A sorting domain-containing protein, partial [Bacteroidia bacterium]
SVVDIYDNSTGLWTTANLSQARGNLSATAVGTKVFFAGGSLGFPTVIYYSVVDIYDNTSTGINESNKNESITIYPNPTTGNNQLTIDNGHDLFGMQIENVAIYDLTGREVYSENHQTPTANPEIIIDVSKFPAGVYSVQIQTADFMVTKKLVIEK